MTEMFSSLSFSEQNLLKPIVDSLLSTLHASANRILRCEANAYFIGSGYASSLSFFFSGCRPRFSRLAASPLNASARALPLLNLKKKRDCSQSIFSRECSFKINITCWPLPKVSRHSSVKGVISNISKTTHSVPTFRHREVG